MRYWLMKSEPSVYGIGDLEQEPDRTTEWSGVRNYQARNFMRDAMRPGDHVFFYHSSCAEPGIAGLAEVASAPYPDPTQFDRKSPYYDPKSKREAPRWSVVDVRATRKIPLVPLAELRKQKPLAGMWLLRRGTRLSITPVTPADWKYVLSKLVRR